MSQKNPVAMEKFPFGKITGRCSTTMLRSGFWFWVFPVMPWENWQWLSGEMGSPNPLRNGLDKECGSLGGGDADAFGRFIDQTGKNLGELHLNFGQKPKERERCGKPNREWHTTRLCTHCSVRSAAADVHAAAAMPLSTVGCGDCCSLHCCSPWEWPSGLCSWRLRL